MGREPGGTSNSKPTKPIRETGSSSHLANLCSKIQKSSGKILARLCQTYFIQGPIRALNPILDGTTEYMQIYSVCRGNVCSPDFVLEYALLSTSAAPAASAVRLGPCDDNLAHAKSHKLRLRCFGTLDASKGAKNLPCGKCFENLYDYMEAT